MQRNTGHDREREIVRHVGDLWVVGAVARHDLEEHEPALVGEAAIQFGHRRREIGISSCRDPQLDPCNERRALEHRPRDVDRFVEAIQPERARLQGLAELSETELQQVPDRRGQQFGFCREVIQQGAAGDTGPLRDARLVVTAA